MGKTKQIQRKNEGQELYEANIFFQISNHKQEQNVEEKKLEQKSEYFEEKCKKNPQYMIGYEYYLNQTKVATVL